MNKNRNRVPETTAEYADLPLPQGADQLGRTEMIPEDDLKSAINDALYPMVPDSMTIREFEELSVKVFRLIWEARGCR